MICLSVKNKNIKNKVIDELKYCSKESSIIINYNQKNEINNKDTFEKIFDNNDLEKDKNYNNNMDDGEFNNILLFHEYTVKKADKNKEILKRMPILLISKSMKLLSLMKKTINYKINIVYDISFNINQIKIIYINELISVKNINDNNVIKYLDVFILILNII